MKKKIISIFICMLLIVTIVFPSFNSEIVKNKSIGSTSDKYIFNSSQNNPVIPIGNWLDDTYLVSSESINTSSGPAMVVDQDGNVHIAWTEKTDNLDWYILYKCLPIDATWDDNPWDDYPTELVSTESTPSITSTSPTMFVEEDGTVHIAWKDGTDISSENDTYFDIFYKCKSPGMDWIDHSTEVVSVETTEQRCNDPTIVVDSDRTVHIVWISEDYLSDGEMHYNYKPLGGDWSHTSVIGSGDYDYEEPTLEIDPSDKLHLVYGLEYTGESDDKDIFYRNKSYSGSWSSSILVSELSDEDSERPKLALSNEDPPTVHVTWYEEVVGHNDEIFYRECTPVWDSTEQVTDTTNYCSKPSIVVRPLLLSNYRLHIAYSECVNPASGDWDIQIKWKNVGDTWSTTTTTISTDATEMADFPVLCIEHYYYTYRLHCAWDDTTPYTGSGSDEDIVYKRTSPPVFVKFNIPFTRRGCSIAIQNPQAVLLRNIPWWIDIHCKWLIFGETHAEGVIDQLQSDETKIITHKKFFGLGPALVFAQVDEAVITAKAFIIGPFVFLQKPPNPRLVN